MSDKKEEQIINGAGLLIKALKANGIKNLYGLVGIPVTDLMRLAQMKGMKFYGFRREDSAVNAAAIAGYLTGRPGVAVTVSAPGFLNGLVALTEATKNCFPAIMISGSSERHLVDMDRGEYEGLDQYNVAKPFVKAAYRIDRPEDVGLGVARAIRAAISGRPGGVYLDVPGQMLGEVLDPSIDADSTIMVPVDPAPKQIPSDESIERAVELLKSAKKPVILLGKGAAYAKAEKQVLDLVESTNIPYQAMSMAKGLIPDTNEHSAAAARSLALGQADVVLLIGARLNWLLGQGQPPRFGAATKFIQIDVDASEMDSNRHIDAPLAGDIISVLDKLVPAVKAAGIKAPQEWLDAIAAKTKANTEKMAARYAVQHNPMGFYNALLPVKDLIAKHPDTYLVNEGANALDICRNVVDILQPRHRLDTGTWGVMGIGMGYAVGAAVETGKRVVAVEGDSAFGFDAMDIETICRYHLPVTVVVLNNGGVYNGKNHIVPDQNAPTYLAPEGRYDMLATAFGGKGVNATTPEELTKALDEAYESGEPTVINAVLDPNMGGESGHIGNLNPNVLNPTLPESK